MTRHVLLFACTALATLCLAAGEGRDRAIDKPSLPMVVLAHDGTGDFGPETANTRTAGWQEAINSCVERKRDLYVKGGWGGETAIYNVSDTIHIPATQDFRIDGGAYVVNWTGPQDRDLLVVDSGMDCHFTLGILVYGGLGAALRIRPANPVPIDKFAVFTDSEIRTSSIADPRPFQRGERKGGAGVIFDTSRAPIVHADFYFTAVLNFATCIEASATGSAFAFNRIECVHLHTNADNSTLLKLGNQGKQDTFRIGIGVDQGATGVKGVDLFGSDNTLEITTRGGFPKSSEIIFEGPARGNQVNIIHGRDPFDPFDILTDRAGTPTNQITWTGAPARIRTVKADAGEYLYTQRLYPATVRISGGTVSGITLVRGTDSVDYGPAKTREILMSVGDQLKVRSKVPPTLEIVPLKVR